MKNRILGFVLIFTILSNSFIRADEGMWIPLLLNKYNIKDMQAKGFKLTAEDIYSINHASMKDAVFIFGRGCTGELISDQGLIITNHHCGYSNIQYHSSLEHDYLTNGFWAMSKDQELPNPKLTVTFLERMEDVTNQVLVNVNDNMTETERQAEIQKQIQRIELSANGGGKLKATVKSFFYGNEYYLFVSKVYTDVRLVGAPPSAIGKFGGDTDNWMWPRHTGDFSLFRIYANKDNEPAEFSLENVPYKPKKYFPISLKGVRKGDFTMVFGYPGSTEEYLTSYAVKMLTQVQNPHRIGIRQAKIDILSKYMESDAGIRIKYSSKYASISNYWKKWIGENRGLNRMNAIQKKETFEKEISQWIQADENRKLKFGNLLPEYEQVYAKLSPLQLSEDYIMEAIVSLDIVRLSRTYRELANLNENSKPEEIQKTVANLKKALDGYFKDYDILVDKDLFAEMIVLFTKNMDKKYFPEMLKLLDTKFKGNTKKYVDYLYSRTIFADKSKLQQFLDSYKPSSSKKLLSDPIYNLSLGFVDMYLNSIAPGIEECEIKLSRLNRIWMQAIIQYNKEKVLYPDANSTLRVSFGQVDDYMPLDGVKYLHFTTLKGIIEKDNPNIYDYKVPAKLKELYQNKDFGDYAENGEMHVAFTASNHTTGGNSGSPVLNGDGQLIGVNFDRNWEGTMSDIMYDPEMCRNISLDIRYALFIIDKLAGAKHLVDEMTIIQ